jgi:tight adherence protein B
MSALLHWALCAAAIMAVAVTIFRTQTQRLLDRRADEICGLAKDGVGNFAAPETLYRSHRWERILAIVRRLGLSTASYSSQLTIALSPLIIAAASILGGWKAGGVAVLAVLFANAFIIRWFEKRRVRRFVQALPSFLERVRRFVLIGNTFQQGFIRAAKQRDPALNGFLDAVVRRVQHGAPFADCIDLLARYVDEGELYMFAAYVRSNAKFGGKIADNLGNLITSLATKDRFEREIAALTAETRASAGILLGLTVGLFAIVSLVNPSYLDFFFHEEIGRILLVVTIGWPLLGILIMRRILDLDL